MNHAELTTRFRYEPETGRLRQVEGGRKPYPWRAIGSGKRYLAYTHSQGTIYLHQAVWLYHHGYIPNMIDHINGNPLDNRIENLRPCTATQNQFNIGMKASNRSGAKGVVFCKACKSRPWQAKIGLLGKKISLGYYASKEQAAQAYLEGAKRIAGEFARV